MCFSSWSGRQIGRRTAERKKRSDNHRRTDRQIVRQAGRQAGRQQRETAYVWLKMEDRRYKYIYIYIYVYIITVIGRGFLSTQVSIAQYTRYILVLSASIHTSQRMKNKNPLELLSIFHHIITSYHISIVLTRKLPKPSQASKVVKGVMGGGDIILTLDYHVELENLSLSLSFSCSLLRMKRMRR